MSAPSKFDTLTVQNIINAYRSAYYSVHRNYPQQCEFVERGVILIDSVERDRSWIIREVERLRKLALENAEKNANAPEENSKRGRLFRMIRMFSSGGAKEEKAPPTTPCPHCNVENSLKANFCQKCGGRMALDDIDDDNGVSEERAAPGRVGVPIRQRAFSRSEMLHQKGVIVVHVGDDNLQIPIRRNLFLGRDESHNGITTVVDLRPYGGYRMGVSHRHAEIFLTDDHHLEISDLGSSNGTFLNGEMLNPLHSYRLCDGDHIQLGDLEVQIFFNASEM